MDSWVWICISIVLIEFHSSSINVQNLWNTQTTPKNLSYVFMSVGWNLKGRVIKTCSRILTACALRTEKCVFPSFDSPNNIRSDFQRYERDENIVSSVMQFLIYSEKFTSTAFPLAVQKSAKIHCVMSLYKIGQQQPQRLSVQEKNEYPKRAYTDPFIYTYESSPEQGPI